MQSRIAVSQPKLSIEDKMFRCSILLTFIKNVIPVNKIDHMRKDLEYIAKKSLQRSGDLKANYISMILKEEIIMQREELRGKIVFICFDATPRQGDVFNLIARYIHVSDGGKVEARQRLINVSFLAKSMDADSVCGEVRASLNERHLVHEDVKSVSVDACSVNIRAIKTIEGEFNVKWFMNLCLSHLANNAGECANFIILSQVWSLVQKIFANSDNAKKEWESMTGTAWKTYSETRWYSKFEVLQDIYIKFA